MRFQESKGFPENFGYLSSEAVTEIMKYLEKLWDLPGMTPSDMPRIIDEARNVSNGRPSRFPVTPLLTDTLLE